MSRRVSLLVGFLCLIASFHVGAPSHPAIAGTISGRELCPQEWCGKAYFFGEFKGTVNNKWEPGLFSIEVTHGDVPQQLNETAPINDGAWTIRTSKRVFSGTVTGGTLTNIGDEKFAVVITLALMQGGSGTLTCQPSCVLDHGPDIPSIEGPVS
jgi:hypothetical protein